MSTPEEFATDWTIKPNPDAPIVVFGSEVPDSLEHPHVWIHVWPVRAGRRRVPFDAVQEVAGKLFPGFERFDLPDPPQTSGVEPYESVVEAITQFDRTSDEPTDRAIADGCFDRCLWAVNKIVLAVANATKDVDLRPYSIEELDPFVLLASRPLTGPVDVEPVAFLVNHRLQFPRRLLTEEEISRVNSSLVLESVGQPFLEYGRLSRGARRASEVGEYALAVILACVAGEVLLNLTLRALLVEVGRAADLGAVFSDGRAFSTRLRSDLGPLLGGNWNPETPTGAVSQCASQTQRLRHRIVHAGHEPTRAETASALEGGNALESFVFERLAERRYRYPKTALSVLGEPGLRRRKMWNQRMQKVASPLEATLPDFWRAIRG